MGYGKSTSSNEKTTSAAQANSDFGTLGGSTSSKSSKSSTKSSYSGSAKSSKSSKRGSNDECTDTPDSQTGWIISVWLNF